MSLSIPPIIGDYFNAANHHDADGVMHCFSPDAVVRDDGKIHQGPQAIRAWNEASSKEYNAISVPLSARNEGAHSIVNCRVSGNFSGSPVELKFAFTLADNGITSLEITA